MTLSLLTEIRDLAVKSDFPVAELLRRCTILTAYGSVVALERGQYEPHD